jgi:hypothetical protein
MSDALAAFVQPAQITFRPSGRAAFAVGKTCSGLDADDTSHTLKLGLIAFIGFRKLQVANTQIGF